MSILATKFCFGKATIQIKPNKTQILPPDGISHDPNILIRVTSTCGQLFVIPNSVHKQQQVPNVGCYHYYSRIRKDLLSYENLL